jgi:hypothetical protein
VADTIDEVIEQLDTIIADSLKNNDPMGYFAYIYRRTTAEIKRAILDKKFEDNARMEKFDVLFANKYLDAYRDFHSDKEVCGPWRAAFRAKNVKLTIIQHIILGMNAHINYDLGICAAEFNKGKPIELFKNDFMAVNQVLASLVDELQRKVGRVSRLMFLLDWIGNRRDEAVMNFSMARAREQAWNFATSLAAIDITAEKNKIATVDEAITRLGQRVISPPGSVLKYIARIIAFFEDKNVRKIISKLEK